MIVHGKGLALHFSSPLSIIFHSDYFNPKIENVLLLQPLEAVFEVKNA